MAKSPALARLWWLVRGINEQQSFVFPVPISVEEDEPNVYGATIPGLEDHMAATGRTAEEAERNAIDLFKMTVDDALEAGMSVSHAIGTSEYMTGDFPITKADEFFKAIHNLNLRERAEDDEEWRSIPMTAAFLPSAAFSEEMH